MPAPHSPSRLSKASTRIPCHWAESSLVRVGPIVDDLAAALAGTRGVFVTGPVATDFGGYAAQHVTLDAPKSFSGCTNIDDPFHLWGIPQTHSLMPGEHDQIWISQVGSTRLVAYSEVYPTTPRAGVDELGRIVASIRLERFAAIAETSPTPPPTEIPSWPSIVDGAPLHHIGYEQRVHLYEYLPDGTVRRVAARYLASLLGQSGWLGREQGMAKDAGTSPRARVGWSSVASVYLDPCHWQTSTLGTADPPLMRNQDGLTEALNGWWPTATDSKVSADYKPAPFAPSRDGVAKSHRVERARLYEELDLTVPSDLDVASCDGGEYRLWERTGWPAEERPARRTSGARYRRLRTRSARGREELASVRVARRP